ncbi:hypothetical protein D9758_013446 [Tetrapyrgos nigripes]|uniref:Uncharacterized protein n=1 Tax=Tetrapyrgos nigripes TaxID=182062 RepID=A0A8H5FRY0_9AGAR|nr:hypothetical protein D9758_013446 [Tetrapyrgos nigripes]
MPICLPFPLQPIATSFTPFTSTSTTVSSQFAIRISSYEEAREDENTDTQRKRCSMKRGTSTKTNNDEERRDAVGQSAGAGSQTGCQRYLGAVWVKREAP